MIWQDIIFTVGGWFFLLLLLPSITSEAKPAFLTSLGTGVVLIAYVAAMASLGCVLGAVSTALTALSWFFLAWQRKRQTQSASDG
ncbi:MAG: hypothetical protein KKB70_06275 [Proteobacteria bacterium]|nr:hypothetical protein [Pseudomonadota bacterium]